MVGGTSSRTGVPQSDTRSLDWSAALKVRPFGFGASKMAGNFDFRAIESMIVFAVSAIPVATDYIEAPRGEADHTGDPFQRGLGDSRSAGNTRAHPKRLESVLGCVRPGVHDAITGCTERQKPTAL